MQKLELKVKFYWFNFYELRISTKKMIYFWIEKDKCLLLFNGTLYLW